MQPRQLCQFFQVYILFMVMIFRCSSLKQKQDYVNTAILQMKIMERLITLFVFFCFVSYLSSTDNSGSEMLFTSMDFIIFQLVLVDKGGNVFPVHLFYSHDNDKYAYWILNTLGIFIQRIFTRKARFTHISNL